MTLSRFAFFAALVATPIVQASPVLYGITFGDQLITINPSTGSGALVGALDSSMFGYDLGAQGGNLYTYDQQADRIRQLDPATGHTVGTINIGAGDLTGEGALAFNSSGTGVLATADGPDGQALYTFGLSPGSAALLATSSVLYDALAFDSGGTLYGLNQSGVSIANLYTINTTTGAPTLVGSTGTGGAVLAGLAFANDGTLFAALSNGGTTNSLYTINKSTGAATLVGAIGSSFPVSGIAFLDTTAVPEASTASVLMIGLTLLVLGTRVRLRRAGFAANN